MPILFFFFALHERGGVLRIQPSKRVGRTIIDVFVV